MILCNKSSFMNSQTFRNYYIYLCENKIVSLLKDKSIGLSQLLQIYDLNDIKSALQSINIDKNNNLYIPDQSNESKIIRYLEFGGENVKATHLFSNINKSIINL